MLKYMRGDNMATSYEYNKKYAEAYEAKQDRLILRMPKGEKEKVQAFAAAKGESVNGLIRRLLAAEMAGPESD